MREIRTSGSEGGAGREPRSYLYPGIWGLRFRISALKWPGDVEVR